MRLVGGAAVIFLCAFVFASTAGTGAQEPESNFGIGSPEVFLPKYLTYRAQQLNNVNPDILRIRLGYVKGLSRSFVAMVGEMAIDLESGGFEVSLKGLAPGGTYSVWLVDRTESANTVPDTAFNLATILATAPSTLLTGVLDLNLPLGFTIDRVVVAPGAAWGAVPLAAGTVNVFQKIFFRRLTLLNESTGAVLFDDPTAPPRLFALVPDLAAETDALLSLPGPILGVPSSLGVASSVSLEGSSSVESSGGSVRLDRLISQGAQLFFGNTFGGNGRTCGTCHPSSNNFTIDAKFISTLPANDPLFVAEFNPALAQLERPRLMRSFGLILENLDGFSDPTNKFVMRGVPHTLGLQVALERDTSLVDAPAEMTGWSGDGSPGTGSLREFAIGAVTQHFTKTLERVEGRDFELPSEHQLDAMEAFQLSLGRNADIDLSRTTFNDENVDHGRSLFINGTGDPAAGGTCAFCHSNAGALSASLQNQNRNFNTNVEDVEHPARNIENFPPDGGFGRTPNDDGTFGNRTFNTASAVEAADTAPFFHNNVVSTLEGVVGFYSGPEFNGPRLPPARFNFNQTQTDQLADFMRAVNTLQNIDVARRELQEILALRGNPKKEVDTRLQTAFDDTQDAIDVLTEGGIFPAAVAELTSARNQIAQAQNTDDSSQRRTLIQQAITRLDRARNVVATVGT
jgi:cytochrome c peroxidase